MTVKNEASEALGTVSIEYFATSTEFQKWLPEHRARATEQWVGYHKKGTGTPSITWPESVDTALCFGWVDGLRKKVDATRYKIRFTPRKPTSIWSAVNIKRVAALTELGLMQAAGLKAFSTRRKNRSGIYSYEQRNMELPEACAKILARKKAASEYFRAQPPGFRTVLIWWVVSAKQEATRGSRLNRLIAASAEGRRL